MPLNKQIVPITFNKGINTKVDPKQVMVGELLRLENGVFVTPEEIRKRGGYVAFVKTALSGPGLQTPTITVGIGISSFNSEVDIYDGLYFYSYNSPAALWMVKDNFQSAKISVKAISASPDSYSSVDSASHSAGLTRFTYYNGTGYVTSVIDRNTGEIAQTNVALGAGSKTLCLGNFFFSFSFGPSGIVGKAISAVTISTGATNVAGLPNDNIICFDATVIGSKIVCVYGVSADHVYAFTVDALSNVSASVLVSTDLPEAVTVFGDASNQAWIVYAWGTGKSKYKVYNNDLSSVILGLTVINASATAVPITHITGAVNSTTAYIAFEEGSSLAPNGPYVLIKEATLAGSVSTGAQVLSVGLAGKGFFYSGVFYFLTVYPSDNQSTYFLYGYYPHAGGAAGVLDRLVSVVGKIAQGLAGGLIVTIDSGATIPPLPEVSNLSSGVYLYPFLQTSAVIDIFGNAVILGINAATITLGVGVQATTIGNQSQLSGGQLWAYDGSTANELGFHLFPESIVSSVSGAGGNIAAGTYQYVMVYQWTDIYGQIHRSAPSVPISVTTTGSTSKVTLTAPALRVTNKSYIDNVFFRTAAAGTIFYRISEPGQNLTTPTSNNTTIFADELIDADIIGNEQLYTTGGEVENIAPPAVLDLTTYRSRLIVIPSDNPRTWWPSKQVIPGSPVEFSDLFVQNIDSFGGDLTAVEAMDDKLIFFKAQHIFYVVGDGPSPNGSGSDYGNAQLITTDTGCDNASSVVVTPVGIMFHSLKGIYLLNRGLAVEYIGDKVEFYNSQTITSAVLLDKVNQVRFTLNNGIALVYDYYVKQWEVFTNISAVGATLYQSLYTYVNSAGLVQQESESLFTDNGAIVQMLVQTGWLSFAGLQGFQRVYELLILGEYESAHTLTVQVYYDFDTTVAQTTTVTPTSTAPYQWRILLNRQKCEAIRFQISDSENSPFGEALRLSALALKVGVKGGLNRLPAARSFE